MKIEHSIERHITGTPRSIGVTTYSTDHGTHSIREIELHLWALDVLVSITTVAPTVPSTSHLG
jgi:hypothetical protein